MWQETGMCFLNPQCWDSCEGVSAGFLFVDKSWEQSRLFMFMFF